MDTVPGLLGAPMVPPLPGQVRAYYGNSTSCIAYNLYATDWAAAQQAPDKALWSLAPQSTTKVYNRTYGGGRPPREPHFGGMFWPDQTNNIPAANQIATGNIGAPDL
jgi:hypothetical protein